MKKSDKGLNKAEPHRLRAVAKRLRRHALDMIFTAQAGHIGGSFSLAEILACLYFHVAKINPDKPDWSERDRILISKGHCCPMYYAALAERGFFSLKTLETFDRCDSVLQGHPDVCAPGIDMPSGSLGMGLSVGVGMALAARLKNKGFHTYCVLGDGELQSGQIWEAGMSAAKYHLGNLTAIIDNNQLQVSGFLKDIMPIEPLKEKWRAFDWHVFEVDGHNIPQILDVLKRRREIKNRPVAIIAKTVKGKGVSFMENSPNWHARIITRDEYDRAILEIDNG
jgi:transketolase